MALSAPHWHANPRLVSASENRPAMHAGDGNRAAIGTLQNILIATGFDIPAGATGVYMQQTANAVRQVEIQFTLGQDQGVAGKEVFNSLDRLLTSPSTVVAGGASGVALATADAPLALRKVGKAIKALQDLQATLTNPAGPEPAGLDVTRDALRLHFRLTSAPATIGVARPFTKADLDAILLNYDGIQRVLRDPAARFRDDIPTLGPLIAAEAIFARQVTFGPVYRNFDWRGLGKIGDHSRAAVMIHESTHVIDAISGNDAIHISEFDPGYDRQTPELSMHNPSSYAGFAAHVDLGRDPSPRFGLGPGARGL
ncbi:hypothetical protein [Terrarubrum flagellatum]|uniref:hypothetical protein n=1 Tax=Terrirubrum flagellatum TaxID=2895980 RepID=UPI0031453AA6